MKVLIACEFSGTVRDAFRARGHDAWSCDLVPCAANPEWHIQGDAIQIMAQGWDLMIAHPPCTHLAVSGAKWFDKKREDGRQQQGIDLFMQFAASSIQRWCIENPVGIMSTLWRSPDQVIQPYYFGDEFQKTTCLWLHGLPKLIHIADDDMFDSKTHVGKGEIVQFSSGKRMPKWINDLRNDKTRHWSRSKTFPGIANAMAEQWGAQ